MSTSKAVAIAATLLLTASVAGAQMGHQTGQGMHQDQMMQMQEMMHRMDGAMHQAHQMQQAMAQYMESHHDAMMQQHQMMESMDKCLGNMAESLHSSMDQYHRMMGDEAFTNDPDMRKDMDQLRDHMSKMTTDVEGALKTAAKMQERIGITPEKP